MALGSWGSLSHNLILPPAAQREETAKSLLLKIMTITLLEPKI